MAMPKALTRVSTALNPTLRNLAGHGWFVEIEHRGRKTGTIRHTPLVAFPDRPDASSVTVALTYGPTVDWYRNAVAAGGMRMRMNDRLLTLGAPTALTGADGLHRMPFPAKHLLVVLGIRDFAELPVLEDRPWPGAWPAA